MGGVRQSNTCTVSRALLTDLSGGTCGVGATGYSQGDWYVLEGYLYLPQVASGQVTIRASNLDFGGTARAEYVAFMISSDDKLENLQFLGEAQTAFQREALIDFTIPVGDDVGASCASDVRAFRLFLFDNTDASAATLTWDIGDGFEEIPSSAFGTSADQAEICAPPTASDDADTTSRGIPVTIDVLSNDAPGDPSYPLVPTSVQLIDPSTSNPVSSVTVPGEGTWTVDPLTGEVTFSPVPDFTGVTTPVDYIVKDTLDQTAEAQIVVTVVGAYDDRSDGNVPGSAVSVPVLGNDAGVLDPGTVRIVDPATGDPVTVLVVPGEGRWSVDSGTGVITFVPEVGFTGNPTPIGYTVEDVDGNLTGATVTVTYQSAVVDVAPDTGGSGVAGGDDGPPSSSDNLLRGRLADTGGIGIRLIGVAVLLLVGGAFLLGASRRRMT